MTSKLNRYICPSVIIIITVVKCDDILHVKTSLAISQVTYILVYNTTPKLFASLIIPVTVTCTISKGYM